MSRNEPKIESYLAAILQARQPLASSYGVAFDAMILCREGRRAKSYAEKLCNFGEGKEGNRNRREKDALSRIQGILTKYHLVVKFEGDPRGSCLKLFSNDRFELPRSTWGDGFGVY